MSNTISKEIYQRLVLLHLIRQFPRGVMGSFRLQKVLYFATREAEWPPFTFHHTQNGQYSYDVRQVLNEMAKEDLLRQEEFRGRYDGGSKWLLSDKFESDPIENALSMGFPELATAIDNAANKYGRKQQDDLDRLAHGDPGLEETTRGEVLLAESAGDEIPTLLDEDDVDDVEMLLSRNFLKEMSRFAQVVAETAPVHSRVSVDESLV